MAAEAEAVKARRSRVSPVREGELFDLVIQQLREVGYEAFSVEALAARARMSKATIYRQWGGKPELVTRAVERAHARGEDIDIDTGTLAGDLKAYLERVHVAKVPDYELNRAMAQAVHCDTELRAAFREFIVKPRLLLVEEALARGIARGELSPDCKAIPYVKNILIGAFAGKDFFEDPVDAAFLRGYVDHVIVPALGLRRSANDAPGAPVTT